MKMIGTLRIPSELGNNRKPILHPLFVDILNT